MTTIVTRSGKGSSLSWSEVDSNFTNLNTDKAETSVVDLKAPLASPTFTGTVSGITSTMVGLGNVDNTSDATKNAAAAVLTNKTITAGKLKAAQLGDSATATNNFTLTSETADGTMKLARGNIGATTQDILTVDANGQIAMPNQKIPTYTAAWTSPIGSNTGPILLQISETYDSDNAYSNGRFTPQVAGWYQVNAAVLYQAATTLVYAIVTIRKNATTYSQVVSGPYATFYARPAISGLVYLNGTTDYVEIWQDISGTGAITIHSAESSACLVRRA